jgi:Cu-processing system ATP-binding protein
MITIKGLKKTFNELEVLKGLDLEIPTGQATGIVGPNGSGKTTLIKHLLGLVKSDEGRVEVDGLSISESPEYRQLIGYMPQMAQYPENMKVKELIEFIIKIRGQEPVYRDELTRLFELEKEMKKSLRVLSGGTKQKVGALIALMFDAPILILDEPTAGLDPKSSHYFKEWVKKERQAGKTILLTSHIMSEIEELSDHMILLVEGTVRFHGTHQQFIERNNGYRLERAVAHTLEEVAA